MDKKSIILTLFAGEYEGVGMKPPNTKKYIESLHNMNTLHQTMELLLTSDEQKVFEDYLLAFEILIILGIEFF